MRDEHDRLRGEVTSERRAISGNQGRVDRRARFRRYDFWVLGVYLISFLNPLGLAVSLIDGDLGPASSGFLAFGLGFWFLLYSPVELYEGQVFPLLIGLAWLANPLFWVGVFRLARREWSKAAWMGAFALLVAVPAYQMSGVMSALLWRSISLWENAVMPLGYLIWLISMALLIVPWACGARRRDRRKPAPVDADF